jgi:predicted transcriptional regulator
MAMTSVRMPDELIERLEATAARLRRSKGWVINDAVREYVEREERRLQRLEETREALSERDDSCVVDGKAVVDWLDSWGTEEARKPPL